MCSMGREAKSLLDGFIFSFLLSFFFESHYSCRDKTDARSDATRDTSATVTVNY